MSLILFFLVRLVSLINLINSYKCVKLFQFRGTLRRLFTFTMVDSRPYWCPIESHPLTLIIGGFLNSKWQNLSKAPGDCIRRQRFVGQPLVHFSKGISAATYTRDNNMTDKRKQREKTTTILDMDELPVPALLKTRAPVVNPYKPLAPTPAPEGVTAPTGSSFSGIRLTR